MEKRYGGVGRGKKRYRRRDVRREAAKETEWVGKKKGIWDGRRQRRGGWGK